MFKEYKILCFIGARGGSKGLKNKNIMNFCRYPLIAWTIKAALESCFVDRVIVSTDYESIAEVAKKLGADVPFLRPKRLAKDNSDIRDAVRHCIDWLEKKERANYDFVLRLQPTSPLRTAKHIDEAIKFYFKNRKSKKDTLVSVFEMPSKTIWIMAKDGSGYINFCLKKKDIKPNRQEAGKYYLPNGAVYFGPQAIVRSKGFYSSRTMPFFMNNEDSIDIDTKEDFDLAKEYFKRNKIRFK